MKKRRLGSTEIEVSPIGLGTWQFSKGRGLIGGFWRSLDEGETRAVVKAALDGGIDWFDTAEVYGRGDSERSLAKALSEIAAKPGSFRVATKWWPMLRSSRNIGKTIGERLACLAPWPIDLYQIHQPFSLSSVPRQLGAMADLVEAGMVKARGVTRSQVALNWLINFWGETVVAIPGASRPAQATAAAGAMSFDLSSEELASLDRLSREATNMA
ncbi:MAG TPA: aldo/keto reductase [Rectinemataceae bacterium]|nr:aldo/keto reductase [Rectinemataceae bacterium]